MAKKAFADLHYEQAISNVHRVFLVPRRKEARRHPHVFGPSPGQKLTSVLLLRVSQPMSFYGPSFSAVILKLGHVSTHPLEAPHGKRFHRCVAAPSDGSKVHALFTQSLSHWNRSIGRMSENFHCGWCRKTARSSHQLASSSSRAPGKCGLNLAVLSARETAAGEHSAGENLAGLQRFFHLAGANTVIGSLWPVDDSATVALMALLYRGLWGERLPPEIALRKAQLAILNEPQLIARNNDLSQTNTDHHIIADLPLSRGRMLAESKKRW
jgi:CHAT domain